MNEDFSNLNLFWPERIRLYVLYRFRRNADVLGPYETALLQAKLVTVHYSFHDTLADATPSADRKACVTERYVRYLRWKKNQTISRIFGSVLLPFVVAVLSTIATQLILQWLESAVCMPIP